MPHFCVLPADSDDQAYWVLADSTDHARRLVALNVAEASGAENHSLFYCAEDATQAPPVGLIYRRLYGPIAVEKC